MAKYIGKDIINKNKLILITRVFGCVIDCWHTKTDWGYIIADDNTLEGL